MDDKLVFDYESKGEYCMAFEGNTHVSFANNDYINLSKWKFEIEFSLSDVSNGCFIFDKRNGQWHRNYCFGFITPTWFEHHATNKQVGSYLFVDVGDGRRVEHELTNGLAIPAELVTGVVYDVVATYSNDALSMSLNASDHSYNRTTPHLGDVRGNGPLIIGGAGDPYQSVWPEYGLGPFKGSIESLKFWDIGDVESEITKQDIYETRYQNVQEVGG